MPKINQEEYEVLKGLDDKWEWIARDKDDTLVMGAGKNERYLDGWFPPENIGDSLVADEINAVKVISEWGNLFQFIKWEDEDPYNIQELIEEYIYDNQPKLFIDGQEQSFEFIEESEEKEVKKQKLIEKWESAIGAAEFYGRGKEDRLIEYMRNFVDDLNQLDEPEVLSSDWIKDNQLMWTSIHGAEYYVPANKLYGKIVPKQIKPKELYKAITGISPSIEEVCDSSGTETFLDESVSVERIIEEIMKVFESSGSEITEEPETVASVIVDFSRSVTRLKEVLNMEVEELEE